MKEFKSRTSNGGKTIILESLNEAIKAGYNALKQDNPPESATPSPQWFGGARSGFDNCVKAINQCSEKLAQEIETKCEEIKDIVDEIAPSLSASASSLQASEEGYAASVERLAAGDEQAMFRKNKDAKKLKDGAGDGAYRIIINTDVSWWGDATDNAALMGALISCLARFRPVEIWIQQGWMGGHSDDGVTLFKLEFTSFTPSQIHFWLGHPHKDSIFSWAVNRGLGRKSSKTSVYAEVEADMYLRGDWMGLTKFGDGNAIAGYKNNWHSMSWTDKKKVIAEWVKATAMKIIFVEDEQGFSE